VRASRRLQENRGRWSAPLAVVSYPSRITVAQAESIRHQWAMRTGRPLVILDQGAEIAWEPRGSGRKAGRPAGV
jgi:hypothetical protein